MNYVTDDTMNAYLRSVQPMYDGVLGDSEGSDCGRGTNRAARGGAAFKCASDDAEAEKYSGNRHSRSLFLAGLMCRYLPEEGTVTTIDRYEVMLKDARVNIKRMGLEDKIKILEGDAADILRTLEGPYDVIFMDAAKGQYQAFLPHCLRLLPVGGLLIVDDVLQGGTIAQTRFSVPRRQRTIHKRLRNFLWEITHHDALETSIIPIGDG